jgi:hypothetical protein
VNSSPHTHEPELKRSFGSSGGQWQIKYGDTTVRLGWWTWPKWYVPRKRKVARCVRRAIYKHDEGSIRAARRAAKRQAAEQHVMEMRHALTIPYGIKHNVQPWQSATRDTRVERSDKWGHEILTEKLHPEEEVSSNGKSRV